MRARGGLALSEANGMFEEEILLNDAPRSIRLETHAGNRIENAVAPAADEHSARKYTLLTRHYGGFWTNRKPACGVYNCFGMVFASRRTAIYDEDGLQVARILSDDGYRKVAQEKDVLPGDLALYYGEPGRRLLHVAVIMQKEKLGVLFALSKWNDTSGEDEHHVQNHCWDDKYDNVRLEFVTDRPDE